ncbi:MAG TPA: alpha/beta hydrolase [Cellvibrio sp.]|nr:alpha/beta hydrolase [Cellvibrio sp.]
MRERVVSIGQANPLLGIISQPEPEAISNPSVAVILLNSGVIHRVGSCRLSVTLARTIVERAGLLTLRFDFSGIGDSEARRSTLTAAESAVEEVQEVMDFLAREKQIKHFILYGLCSGAYASYRTAIKDPRVIGIAQIDGYCYLSWKSYFYHYIPRLFSWTRWSSLLLRKLGLKRVKSGADVSGVEQRFFEVPRFPDFPPQEEVEAGLTQLAQRGLKLFSVFCHGEHYNYEGQFRDCFSAANFGNNHRLVYLTEASHILAEPEDQEFVVSNMAQWVKATANG